jgi:hypothetical protein
MQQYALRLAGLGLAVFLVTFAIRFPADLALSLLRDRLPAIVSWQQVDGSVFDATLVNVELSVPGAGRLVLDRVELATSLAPLLLGRVSTDFRVYSRAGEMSGRTTLRRSGWSIDHIEGGLSLQALSGLAPVSGEMGMTGRVRLLGNGLSGGYQNMPYTGNLTLAAEDVGLDWLVTQGPLGSYAVELSVTKEAGIEGHVRTTSGEALLIVEAAVRSDPDMKRLQLTGVVSAGSNATREIRDILALLGTVKNDQVEINRQIIL